MSIISENTFEKAILNSLIQYGGYTIGNSSHYNRELGLFIDDFISFIKTSQTKRWNKLVAIHGNDIEKRLLQRLYKELDLRGAIDVIRNGFVDYGVRFQMAYFKPVSNMNPQAADFYQQNIIRVYQQLYYSQNNNNSVDLVLSLNGLPIATLELKNQFTGQNVGHALRQYATTRDQRELLFAFNKRALVHFAVDQDDVFMTTKIDGSKTSWLPFNKGFNEGKGNPPNSGNYKTSYLWEDILTKDSWLDIIQNFIHLQVDEIEFNNHPYRKERLIFPRYHQLDAVKKITKDVLKFGIGKNYLIQHSAGSGKSNSIAWLAYALSSLHNATDERIFESVIVVTDRKVLDHQLQNTIYQFEHKTGVVEKIDKNSAQLAAALSSGSNIIITTLQKFPVVVNQAIDLPNRKYAVIIDEAHSSQGGEASKKMQEVLTSNVLEESSESLDDDFDDDDFIREEVERSAKSRRATNNISFFAFTATPKYKTLQVFGQKNSDGNPEAFHLYAMRQAIEEGFILDVLQNYTTYELYFKLTKNIEDDPKLNKQKAAKAIGRFISLHPFNLSQKTEVIVEHFRQIVVKKIGGKAKAMLVTSSRLLAKRYFEEFQRYINEKGYSHNIKILVAFSGKVYDDNYPTGVSEPTLTGYGEQELPQVFEKDDYKILIVADKYQTGFDQPLLHTMYIDKKLSGVKAVQTLSRLNRIYPGKEDTFVLDFANDRRTILDSFQPYYEATTLRGTMDVNHLYDLKNWLDKFQLYSQSDIENFSSIYFDPKIQLDLTKNQRLLYSFTDFAIEKFRKIEHTSQTEFKKGLRSWTNLYSFLAQIMPFIDIEYEKFYAYAKLLHTRLPKRDLGESLHIVDQVALQYYRLQKIQEGSIELVKGAENGINGPDETGIKRPKEEEAQLSEIIDVLNQRFGTEFNEADKLFFDQIEEELMQDTTLGAQAKANQLDTFKYAFEDLFTGKLVERMDQNQEIFEKILEDKDFGEMVKEWMMRRIYRKFNQ